jgi:hypothetical protein
LQTDLPFKDPAADRFFSRLTGVAAAEQRAPRPRRRKDSLWNGAILGAALGTIAGIAASYALVECTDCAGFNVPLTFAVAGGGIGAGLGAGIDALHDRQAAVPARTGRLAVSPLVARSKRALLAVVRF